VSGFTSGPVGPRGLRPARTEQGGPDGERAVSDERAFGARRQAVNDENR